MTRAHASPGRDSLLILSVPFPAADEPIDAAEHVSTAQSSDSPQLFEAETVQLTNESLQSVVDAKKLNASDAALFDFEDGQIEKRGLDTRGRSSCKTSPGDILWPNKLVWTIFDLLLGGGVLEKPPPIGAVCYKDPFGVYNKDDCTEVIDNFTNSTLQYVVLTPHSLAHFSLLLLLLRRQLTPSQQHQPPYLSHEPSSRGHLVQA